MGRSSTVAISRSSARGLDGQCDGLVLSRPLHRLDDVHVARAAADLPGDRLADLLLGRVRIAVQKRPRGHDHARRAEAALEAVFLHEAHLHGVELSVLLHVLDGAHLVAASHRGEHGARLHGLAVHEHGAGAAVAGVAAPVGAGEAQVLAQEVDEQQARLDLLGDLLAVDRHRHLHGVLLYLRARSTARRTARVVSSAARWRLYSALPRWSAVGFESSAAMRPASANSSSDGRCPRRASSARGERIALAPSALRPTPASTIVPASIQTATPEAPTAQSPARRSTFS